MRYVTANLRSTNFAGSIRLLLIPLTLSAFPANWSSRLTVASTTRSTNAGLMRQEQRSCSHLASESSASGIMKCSTNGKQLSKRSIRHW